MVLRHLEELKELLVDRPTRRMVLAAAQDQNSLASAIMAARDGFIEPILVGDKEAVQKIASDHNLDLAGVRMIHEPDTEMAVEIAVKMVRSNQADILMKGKVGTSSVLRALPSHFVRFEVEAYHKLIAVTDVAMNIATKLQDKISIVNNSVACLNKLGIEMPKVAVLGAVEMVSENMQATLDAALLSKMNQRDQIKNCLIDGPLAFDNAISLESANHKGIKSDVAGDTDLLLMPDIEVGNVLYKSLVFFAHSGLAAMLLCATAPIVLTSRSDSNQAKYYSILLAAAISRP